jgi:hypothetical protein
MDRRNRNALLIAVGAISIGAFLLARTFVNSGQAAVAQMEPSELALLASVEKLQRGMSRGEVEAVYGEPDEDKLLRMIWFVNGNPFNGIAVDFRLDGARRVMWISLGRFFFERQL